MHDQIADPQRLRQALESIHSVMSTLAAHCVDGIDPENLQLITMEALRTCETQLQFNSIHRVEVNSSTNTVDSSNQSG